MIPRLNLLRHHRRSSTEQSKSANNHPPSKASPPPIPRTSPPTEFLPPLNLGPSDIWLTPEPTPVSHSPTEPAHPPKRLQKFAEKDRKQNASPPSTANLPLKDKDSAYRKLTLLNPMSLLSRRRSSQTTIGKKAARDLPDNFDPGIIYGTRHPDWSSGPHRRAGRLTPVNDRHAPPVATGGGKELLKVELVTKGGGFKEHFGDGGKGDTVAKRDVETAEPEQQRSVPDSGQHRAPTTAPPSPPTLPPIPPPANEEESDNEGELLAPPDGPPRVTLFDNPLSLPHHLMTNSSRFSFEGSSAAGESTQSIDDLQPVPRAASDFDPDDSDAEMDIEDIDMDGEDDEGFERANEGLFGGEGGGGGVAGGGSGVEGYEDEDEDDGLVMDILSMSIGVAISKDDSPVRTSVVLPEGAFTGVAKDLPTMDPNPSALVPYAGAEVPLHKRIGNPRGYDLDEDSDLDFLEDSGNGIEGYEDEDDMYFDDGIIMDDTPQDISQYITAPNTANVTPYGPSNLLSEEQRQSLSTVGISSGGAMMVEDGSMSGTHGSVTNGGGSGADNCSFPPFINPIGGGLGYTQEHAQFYAPDGTMLDGNGCPLALSTLTQSLHAYQKEQQRLAEEGLNSPIGYESDYPHEYERGESQSGYYSVGDENGVCGYEDDDETMVAAANAEALAYDTEFYGQEFGFYPAPPSSASSTSETPQSYGGYFGPPGGEVLQRPPLLRRPSLTPISERSESSWRNSMVFPVEGWKGLGAQRPLSALSFGGGGGGGEDAGDGSLETLMKLRRSAWGGSNGSIRSSLGTGGGNSPIAAPPGWGVGGVGMSPSVSGGGVGGVSPGGLTSSPLASPVGFGIGMGYPPGLPLPPGLSPPPGLQPPPGLTAPPGLILPPRLSLPPGIASPPPGLSHPGANAMLPTKGSFEEQQLLQMRGRHIMQMQLQMQQSPSANNPTQGYPTPSPTPNANQAQGAFYHHQGIQVQTQHEQQRKNTGTTVDSSYASAVGSPVDAEVVGKGVDPGERRGEVEKWVLGRGGSRGSRGS